MSQAQQKNVKKKTTATTDKVAPKAVVKKVVPAPKKPVQVQGSLTVKKIDANHKRDPAKTAQIKVAVANAFASLGVAPRKGQSEAVEGVIDQFLIQGKRDVVLCAPTGTGKSVIGAASSIAMRSLLGLRLSGLLLTATNVLADQYSATFAGYKGGFMSLAGASNYDCDAVAYIDAKKNKRTIIQIAVEEEAKPKADMCIKSKPSNPMEEQVIETFCGSCEYAATRKLMNTADIVSTNYAMYFVDSVYANKLQPRALTVFDEAHMLNDLYCTFTEVDVSSDYIASVIKNLSGSAHGLNKAVAELRKFANRMDNGMVGDHNYKEFFKSFAETCSEVAAGLRGLYLGERQQGNTGAKYFKMAQAIDRKATNIDNLLEGGKGEHVYGYDEVSMKHYIKTILVGKDSEMFNTSEHRLFMSATITKGFIVQTLGVSDDSVAFLKMDSTFPIENKKVVFYKPLTLNYNTLKDAGVVAKLCANVCEIAKVHIERNDRGLILTPSFSMQEKVMLALKAMFPKVRFIVQSKGMKQQEALEEFLNTEGQCVLVSPSMYEGVDLAGDLSRFQIIVKTPFPALGDARIKKIATDYPEMYKAITLMKLVQGAGRSVRSESDHAMTYITDVSSVGLMSGAGNVWKDEFSYYRIN